MLGNNDHSPGSLSQSSGDLFRQVHFFDLPVSGSNELGQAFVNIPSGFINIFMAIPAIAAPTSMIARKKTSITEQSDLYFKTKLIQFKLKCQKNSTIFLNYLTLDNFVKCLIGINIKIY